MKKEINSNLVLKILSLLMAIILWRYVIGVEDPVKSKTFKNIKVIVNQTELEERDLVVVSPLEPMINVALEGKTSVLNEIEETDIIARVDLSNYGEGKESVPIIMERIPEVTIKSITPKGMTFQIDKLIKKEINIDVETIGELPKGYKRGEPKISPPTIEIEGARSIIDTISTAIVKVDIGNATEDIKEEKTVELINKEGNVVEDIIKNKNTVEVFISIMQEKEVPVELNIFNRSAEDEHFNIELSHKTVRITGKKDDLDKIKSIKTKPIDASTIYLGMIVNLEMPENVHLLTKDEIKLIVDPGEETIEEDKLTETLSFNIEDIKILGLGEGLKIDNESLLNTIELTIEGDKEVIESIESIDYDIQIDLTDLVEGEHIISPLIPAKPDINLLSIVPKDLTINIIKEE